MAINNPQAQSKWDALQSQNSTTIDKLLQGNATPSDIEKLSKVVAQQNELAGKLFDEGIAGAEATADTIVDRLNEDRIAVGKRPLSPKAQDRIFKQTLQRVLQASSEDILGSVQDLLETQTREQQENLETAFERLARIQQERRTREMEQGPVRTLSSRLSSLVGTLKNMGVAGAGAVSGSARRIATAPREMLNNGIDATRSGIRQFGDAVRRPREAVGNATTFVRTSITSMKDAVVRGWDKITGNSNEDEERRSTTWLRKLKGMFGSMKDKVGGGAKKAASMLGKIFGPIGKVLLLALTNPQLIKTITDAVSKYLNFDTISDFISTTWKDMKSGGSEIIDWIIDKVKNIFGFGKEDKASDAAKAKGLATGKAAVAANKASASRDAMIPQNTTVSDARAAIPPLEADIKATETNLISAKARYAANPSELNKLTVDTLTLRIQAMKGRLGGYNSVLSTPTNKPADIQTLTPSVPILPSGDSTSQSKTSVVPKISGGASGPSPASVAAASSATVAVTSTPKYKDGITVDMPKVGKEEAMNNKQAGASPSAGIVSLGSFGFQSGDDTLNLLNMGLIG